MHMPVCLLVLYPNKTAFKEKAPYVNQEAGFG